MVADAIEIPLAPETRGRPREYFSHRAASGREYKMAWREREQAIKADYIAILDFETDPFDAETQELIYPFTACLYSDHFEPIVIWQEDFDLFIAELLDVLENLPGKFMIYAHNGGKFDYMFFVHRLRGRVSFKGRGIMSARIGRHELRDSFHILPEKLASFHKEEFDYQKMLRNKRNKFRDEIIRYMISDCQYLLELVQGFVQRFGFKLSIGMAAMAGLKRHYKIGKLAELTDARLRQYFYGGRVECLAGRGHFVGAYKIYDVNSMYPAVMANFRHPISAQYEFRRKGGVRENTCFVEVECDNFGALVMRSDETNETTAQKERGIFRTTIYEFEAALELGLIENVNVLSYIDNAELTDFSKHVLPIYAERQLSKERLAEFERNGFHNSPQWWDEKKNGLYFKYLLNTGYGKFAQNPRRFKEWYITEPDAPAPEGYFETTPSFRNDVCALWSRPAPRQSFNNVGTAASITGAARALLMRAINSAIDPIYCDTDSLICRELRDVQIDKSILGAWKLERKITEIIINGKKLYAYKYLEKDGQQAEPVVKSKGASGVSWADMLQMYDGAILPFTNKAPTMDRTGRQFYMTRNLRATAPQLRGISRHARSAISGSERIRA